MKIRITTYHKVINRGAILQAYGTFLNLKSLFPEADVRFIDNLPLSLETYELLRAIPRKKSNIHKWKRFILIREDVKKLFSLDKTSLKTLSQKLTEKDILVSGSDCIWRIDSDFPIPAFPNDYWLPYKTKARKISFSTSASGSKAPLIAQHQEAIDTFAKDYDLIAVRDQHTKDMIHREDIVITPDPSFLVPLKLETTYHPDVESFFTTFPKAVGLQIYHNDFPDHVTDYIDSNINNGCLGLTNNFKTNLSADHLINTLQWTNIFGRLSFCITDSFHGTIFNLRNKTPFISLETKGYARNKSKKFYLLSYCGLEDLYLNLEEHQNNPHIISERQHIIQDNWESIYLPKIEAGLAKIQEDLNNYNQKILNLIS